MAPDRLRKLACLDPMSVCFDNLQERDNLERAMECYAAALSARPNFPQSLNNMGVVFTSQGRAQVRCTLQWLCAVCSK